MPETGSPRSLQSGGPSGDPSVDRAGGASRLIAPDALRGLIMVLMAVDHAAFFVARIHPAEYWGVAMPEYPGALAFLTRFVTHLCAPGFFFLMGVGMALFADSRGRLGWSEGRITRHLALRGVLLIGLQLLIENPAWFAGIFASQVRMETYGATAPGGSDVIPWLLIGVLSSLGASLIVWSLLRRLPGWAIAAVSLTAVLGTQLAVPGADQVATRYPALVRLMMLPGLSDLWMVTYPVVPWLGLAGAGILFGRLVGRDPRRAYGWALGTGGLALLLFAALRAAGGFGNLHPPAGEGWIAFLNVTKYPPSLVFVLLTLGIDLVLLAALRGREAALGRWGRPLVVFGRTPLFFYLAHIYLFLLAGLLVREGTGYAGLYAAWLTGLLVLYPLCGWYGGFKARRPADSLWRFF